jgi:hypothetical protein
MIGVVMLNLEDREKVRELFARFCLSIDAGRFDEWVGTYTPDGRFVSPIAGTHENHEGLKKFTDMMAASSVGEIQQRHIVNNLSLNLGSDDGTTECTLTVWHTKHGVTTLYLVGGYNCRVRKIGNDWFFEEVVPYVDTAFETIALE